MYGCYKCISLDLVIVYSLKCASSRIKYIIDQIDDRDNGNVKGRINFYNTTIDKILTKYKSLLVVFFVRNPYDRFISGYSKFLNKNIIQIKFDNRKSQTECNKLTKNGSLSIEEWCTVLTKIPHENVEEHFAPQTKNIGNLMNHKKLVLYDINNLDNFNNFLIDKFNTNLNLEILPKYTYEKPSINKKIIQLINEYYKEDFIKLGYKVIN